jgi:hypothetical protein
MQNALSQPGLQWQADIAGADRRQWEAGRAAHTRRCRSLAPVGPDEAGRLVERFLAERGGATRCPAAYVAESSAATPFRQNHRADVRAVAGHPHPEVIRARSSEEWDATSHLSGGAEPATRPPATPRPESSASAM